ncbi:MAG: metallophosphoesterase family protein [Polyangiales bacterium]
MDAVRSAAARVGAGTDEGAARFGSMVDLILTVSYIDGVFHQRERAFLNSYVDSVLVIIERAATGSIEDRATLRGVWRSHFDEVYRRLETEVAALADEVMAAGNDTYIGSRLRVRALTLFRNLAPADQPVALELVTALVHADGQITKNEHDLQRELHALFAARPAPVQVAAPHAKTLVGDKAKPASSAPTLIVMPKGKKDLAMLSHPLLDPIEQTLSPHPQERKAQIDWDYQLIQRAIGQWQRMSLQGANRLSGITSIDQLQPGTRFLDRFVHVMRPNASVELIVLGDLHGCYSCLKAALLQTNFIQRAWAHQWDPANHPDVKLVLLGDYIDRGRFSFDGVLRAALHLFVSMPDHVILLRGNHEWLRWIDGRISSGVYPAEALASLAPHVPVEMLEAYRVLFEHMPTSFVFERSLFVHAGIAREDTFAERYHDLSSLNDDQLRFQMMWSDPVATDHVPVELQRMNPRFQFGRSQFQAFMQRTGMQSLIRGHEKIDHGFEVLYDLGEHVLLSLFSSGGADNADLPIDSSYREVTPMGLSMLAAGGRIAATPWPLRYEMFNHAPHNGLYRPQPVLDYRYG